MKRPPARPFAVAAARSWIGRFLALAALALQLATASVVPWSSALAAPGLTLGAPICHASGATAPGDQAPGHRSHDCALCPLCQALAQAGSVLAPPALGLPAPSDLAGRDVALPPSRAPPSRFAGGLPYGTGPPAVV